MITNLSFSNLKKVYREKKLTPTQLVAEIDRLLSLETDQSVWIHRASRETLLARAAKLEALPDPEKYPLFGMPFAVKDNIDVAGMPTTAACPAFSYMAEQDAHVVAKLIDAGAICVGKTNLDQFATGLVGTRSPYGICKNAFLPEYISGGSSSGSAVAVAQGVVAFSLGTDTAGSGRVPAALNNLVGCKPTRGILSSQGLVPACRSLDTISIFALCAADAREVLEIVSGYDPADAYSRDLSQKPSFCATQPILGVPQQDQLAFFGDSNSEAAFARTLETLRKAGYVLQEMDFAPFLEAARLLYEGPWVAERYHAVRGLLDRQPDALLPVTRQIIGGGKQPLAWEAFDAQYRLQALKRQADQIWENVPCVLTPTLGRAWQIEEVMTDPIQTNSKLGYYTNFMNLLDYAALALPAGFLPNGLPHGITLFAPAASDLALLDLGARLHSAFQIPMGKLTELPPSPQQFEKNAPTDHTDLAVCGAHMRGLALNQQLLDLGAQFVREATTDCHYRMYALEHLNPVRPALVKEPEGGQSLPVEIWRIPTSAIGGLLTKIATPLGLGNVMLSNGETVLGFIAEYEARLAGVDITHHKGWRNYLKNQTA